MSRKRCHRRVWVPQPPRGLRPKLSRDQVTDLALAHIVNLDDIARGQATADTLWQTVGGVLTWSRVAALRGELVAEMTEQLDVLTSVVERYRRTGRVGFSGTEYQLAKRGVQLMDDLAERVDRATATAAADWAEARVNAWAAQCSEVAVCAPLRWHVTPNEKGNRPAQAEGRSGSG
jgi:hypothetical protein